MFRKITTVRWKIIAPTLSLLLLASVAISAGIYYVTVYISAEVADNEMDASLDHFVYYHGEDIDIQRVVEHTQLSRGGYIFTVEGSRIAHHPDPSNVGLSIVREATGRSRDDRLWLSYGGGRFYAGFYYLGGLTVYAVIPESGFYELPNLVTLVTVAALGGMMLLVGTLTTYAALKATRPIAGLAELVSEIRRGNLRMNRDPRLCTNDELGKLANDMYGLVDNLSSFLDDTITFGREFGKKGNIAYRIDASRYEGSFREMVDSVHGLVEAMESEVDKAIAVLVQLADGDFDAKIDDAPGDLIVLPDTLRKIVSELQTLYTAISELADRARLGDFSLRLDPCSFGGSWAELIEKLNRLICAVEKPLNDVKGSIEAMSRGDFSYLDGIGGESHGIYKELMDACNTVNRMTQGYVGEIARVLGSISDGDLTAKTAQKFVGSYTPIESAICGILRNLNGTLADVRQTVEQVALAAKEIAHGAASLADGATRQSVSIDGLGNAVSLIYDKAVQTSAAAESVNSTTIYTQEQVALGNRAIKSMSEIMSSIRTSSENIARINDVITSIAFQTNLLALNASVEAARAGEHGRGFSVVADEVRTLAIKSQQSAGETSAMIQDNLNNVALGLKAMDDVRASFGLISGKIDESAALISDISEVSATQMDSLSDISAGTSEIARVVSDISALSEESAAASQELSSQAEMLRDKVSYFRLG